MWRSLFHSLVLHDVPPRARNSTLPVSHIHRQLHNVSDPSRCLSIDLHGFTQSGPVSHTHPHHSDQFKISMLARWIQINPILRAFIGTLEGSFPPSVAKQREIGWSRDVQRCLGKTVGGKNQFQNTFKSDTAWTRGTVHAAILGLVGLLL